MCIPKRHAKMYKKKWMWMYETLCIHVRIDFMYTCTQDYMPKCIRPNGSFGIRPNGDYMPKCIRPNVWDFMYTCTHIFV